MKVTILGCGTSSGVPRIGNDWGACDPQDPRNRRTRQSILVEHDDTRVLIDTGPDMREQLLAAGVGTIDAVIWTHDHADHTNGIDDLRQLAFNGGPVRGYARQAAIDTLHYRFGYVFRGAETYDPVATLDVLPDELTVGAIRIRVVDQPHGRITSAGLRFDCAGSSIGYSTDFKTLTGPMARLFEGVDVWIADALRRQPHPTHPTVDEVIGWGIQLRARRTVLVHMDKSLDYSALGRDLPGGFEVGYDGMELVP